MLLFCVAVVATMASIVAVGIDLVVLGDDPDHPSGAMMAIVSTSFVVILLAIAVPYALRRRRAA